MKLNYNISSEKNAFGFNSIQKIDFSKKNSHLNALGSKGPKLAPIQNEFKSYEKQLGHTPS